MRDLACLLAVLALMACSEAQVPPGKTGVNPIHSGSKWPTFEEKHHLQVPGHASESIFLFGAYNNGRNEENILIARAGGKVTLEAWWMDWQGPIELWSLRHTVSEEEFEALWKALEGAKCFDLTDEFRNMSHAMTYWVDLKKGAKSHRSKAYGLGWYGSTTVVGGGGEISPGWVTTVATILGLRERYAHLIRPASFRPDGSIEAPERPRGVMLLDASAAEKCKSVNVEKVKPWGAVLQLGGYRNREILELVLSLLASQDPGVSGSACAVMSWVSGLPPNPDFGVWKKWWAENRESYVPASSPFGFEGETPSGRIHALGRGVGGFVNAEFGGEGTIWALSEFQHDWQGNTYHVYKLQEDADKFVKTEYSGKYGNKGGLHPPTSFVLRVSERKLTFPDYYQEVWVSPDRKLGAAILGQKTKYFSDSVVVLDFEKGEVGKPFQTSHQYATPVVSPDGRYIALAKGWNWANPHGAIVIPRDSGGEQVVPIEPAVSLSPLCFVSASPRGPGYYWERQEDRNSETPGPAEIWWTNAQGTKAELIYSERNMFFRVYGRVTCSADGAKVFVQRRESVEGKTGWSFGWMSIPDGKFEQVLPASVSPITISGAADGSKLLFVHQGQVFEWNRLSRK